MLERLGTAVADKDTMSELGELGSGQRKVSPSRGDGEVSTVW